jgi:hypothetical protein
MSTHIIEWVAFGLKPGCTESDLLQASQKLQDDFLDQQPGFIRRELLSLDGTGRFADLVTWQSHEAAGQAMSRANDNPACAHYFAMLEVSEAPQHCTPLKTYGSLAG